MALDESPIQDETLDDAVNAPAKDPTVQAGVNDTRKKVTQVPGKRPAAPAKARPQSNGSNGDGVDLDDGCCHDSDCDGTPDACDSAPCDSSDGGCDADCD